MPCASIVRAGNGAEQDHGGHEERARLRNAQENRRAPGRSQAGRSGDRSKFSRKPYGFSFSIEPRSVFFSSYVATYAIRTKPVVVSLRFRRA